MSILSKLGFLKRLAVECTRSPLVVMRYLNHVGAYREALEYGSAWPSESYRPPQDGGRVDTTHEEGRSWLLDYFRNNKTGPGIWKWEHYFEVYDRHFSKFIQQPVDVLEIGVFSGGSLNMWKSYFGDRSHIYGVDVEPACKTYEREGVTILIGDQADRHFWKTFKSTVSGIDVLMDDGGHKLDQQIVTLEEMLPHIRPGGVYLCEDLQGIHHGLVSYVSGLIGELNRLEIERTADGLEKYPTEPLPEVHTFHTLLPLLVNH